MKKILILHNKYIAKGGEDIAVQREIELLKENGEHSFIIPNTILTQEYYAELRESILNTCKIKSIINFFVK